MNQKVLSNKLHPVSRRGARMVRLAFVLFVATATQPAFASPTLDQAISDLQFNRPTEALPKLELALRDDPANTAIYLYIGLACEQSGQFDKGISFLRSAIDRGLTPRWQLATNLGNLYARKGSAAEALTAYTSALQEKPDYTLALLNRGNANLRAKDLDQAAADYTQFLVVAPNDPLSPDVRRMLAAIADEKTAQVKAAQDAEAKRLADEAAKAEAARQAAAAEAAKLAEAARKQAFLDSLMSSLNDSTSDPRTLSSGNGTIQQADPDLTREE